MSAIKILKKIHRQTNLFNLPVLLGGTVTILTAGHWKVLPEEASVGKCKNMVISLYYLCNNDLDDGHNCTRHTMDYIHTYKYTNIFP